MSTIQDSLTHQQFSMIMSSLLQSLRIACSFNVFHCVRIGVLDYVWAISIQRLPQCNRLPALCEFANYAVTSDGTKWLFKFYKMS